MARFDPNSPISNLTNIVTVTGSEQEDNHTVYIIQVALEKYCWTVRHRYSHFDDLNDQLVQYWKLDKSLLPPKKLFGNQTESFIQKRKNDLEIYLRTILCLLPKVPPPFAAFLEFPTYEIHGILKSLAKELFIRGDSILVSKDFFHFSPLHLNALSERLKLPEPTCDSTDKSQDISHILDFISLLENATIVGSPAAVGTSNIVPNQLTFELSRFKGLKTLKLQGCNMAMIGDVQTVRLTLETLNVHGCLSALKEVLLCDVFHSDLSEISPAFCWSSVRSADFSYNNLRSIDRSICLLRNIEILNLSHNYISTIDHLAGLPSLSHLDLSFNRFCSLETLHTCLGNIVTLILADNAIELLQGFAKLYSLVTLDLSSNRIVKISEVEHLASLPCLENLTLTANPVTISIDYRTRVLELFESRASDVCLDNECPTAKELDTVAVRVALRRARQGNVTDGRPLSLTVGSVYVEESQHQMATDANNQSTEQSETIEAME